MMIFRHEVFEKACPNICNSDTQFSESNNTYRPKTQRPNPLFLQACLSSFAFGRLDQVYLSDSDPAKLEINWGGLVDIHRNNTESNEPSLAVVVRSTVWKSTTFQLTRRPLLSVGRAGLQRGILTANPTSEVSSTTARH